MLVSVRLGQIRLGSVTFFSRFWPRTVPRRKILEPYHVCWKFSSFFILFKKLTYSLIVQFQHSYCKIQQKSGNIIFQFEKISVAIFTDGLLGKSCYIIGSFCYWCCYIWHVMLDFTICSMSLFTPYHIHALGLF